MIMYPYKARICIIFLLFFVLYGVIAINLYFIQIAQHNFFLQLADKQYKVIRTIYPPRAPLYDRNGIMLALNKSALSAFIIPHQLEQPQILIAFLEKHFPNAVQRLKKNCTKHFMYIQRRLSDEQIALIHESNIPDIHLLQEPNRFYTMACLTPLIGITDIDNNGLCGIEFSYNTQLTGNPTTHHLHKDARSGFFYFAKETESTGQEGTPIYLTVDSTLQFLAHEELAKTVKKFNAREGAIIIMNPSNGDILVMAEYPIEQSDNNKIGTTSTIMSQAYELGSVMKICTALAALEEEAVTYDELIDCQGSKTGYIDGREIHTTIAQGIVPFWDVIAQSNNIGIAQIAQRIQEKLYNHYQRLGFGKKIGINLPGEQAGFINPPTLWSKQSIFSLSYGYEIRATLLQLAQAFAIIANNGHFIKPRLIMPTDNNEVTISAAPSLYRTQSIEDIKKILLRTTEEGTARRASIKGYTVMTKTGSADLLVNGIYNRDKSIFSCAGIIEKGNYKRVIVTFVKEPEQKGVYASTIAAPLFADVAHKMLIHDKILAP